MSAVLAAFAVAVPAQATFPGGNGRIALGRPEVAWNDDIGANLRWSYVATMDPVGRHRRLVASGEFDPAFSPDGRTLATAGRWLTGTRGIFLRRPDGKRIARLTRNHDREPSWSPSGRRLAFSRQRGYRPDVLPGDPYGRGQIYTIGRDGGQQRHVTDNGLDPAWSSRGEIAYEFRYRANTGIRVTDPRGRRTRTLARHARDPDWSPRGDKLAFARCRGDNCGVFVINADGTGLRRLVVRGYSVASPVWSPDGNSIAFSAGYSTILDEGDSRVASISAGGGRSRQLLPSSWSPDWAEYDLSTVDLAWQPQPRR